jgi:hypothetical protein
VAVWLGTRIQPNVLPSLPRAVPPADHSDRLPTLDFQGSRSFLLRKKKEKHNLILRDASRSCSYSVLNLARSSLKPRYMYHCLKLRK